MKLETYEAAIDLRNKIDQMECAINEFNKVKTDTMFFGLYEESEVSGLINITLKYLNRRKSKFEREFDALK